MRSPSLDEEGTIINPVVYGNVGNVDHPNAPPTHPKKIPVDPLAHLQAQRAEAE